MDIRFWYLDVGYWIWVCIYGFEIWIFDILYMGYGYLDFNHGLGLFYFNRVMGI